MNVWTEILFKKNGFF